MLTLILKEGSDAAKTLQLSQDVVTFGRSKENVIILRNIKASRHHAKIERIGGTYQISDLGSGNGTRVNGQKIDFQALSTGDEIRIGDAVVTLKSIDDAIEGEDVSEEPTEQIELQGDDDLKIQDDASDGDAVVGEPISLDDDDEIRIEGEDSNLPSDERETEIAVKPAAPAKPAAKPLQRPMLGKPAPKPAAAPPAKPAPGPAKKPSLADRFKKKP